MRRREFLSLVGAMAVWPIRSKAQSEMPVIGHLYDGFHDKDLLQITAVKEGLLDSGYVEGKNLKIACSPSARRSVSRNSAVNNVLRLDFTAFLTP
jgi:hypothetical protein